MTPRSDQERNLRRITWAVLGMFFCAILLFSLNFVYARRDQSRLVETQLAQYSLLVDLQNAIGYGGLIHNFKNWVLRPEEPAYRDAAVAAARKALTLLDDLDRLVSDTALSASLEPPRAAISSYLAKMDTVSRMHDQGASAGEIDRAVRVDDSSALIGLKILRDNLVEKMSQRHAALIDRRNLLMVLPVLLVAGMLASILLLVRQRTRLQLNYKKTRIDEMEQFTQIAAHDLRAPLRQIQTMAEFAREELDSGDEDAGAMVREHLGTISERVRKLEALIKAVFRYIQIEGASQEISEVDLREMIQDLEKLHVPEGGTVRLEGEFPTIRAQRVELEIILRNMISNAVKHHPENRPTIIVRHFADRSFHRFEVEDNGPGIPAKYADKVFNMFWSLKSNGDTGEVSGVGLALVRRIVNRWGAELVLRNATPCGAVFSFTMPVY